jgi:hypothetical protein
LNRRWIGIELKQEFAEYAITTRIGKGKLGWSIHWQRRESNRKNTEKNISSSRNSHTGVYLQTSLFLRGENMIKKQCSVNQNLTYLFDIDEFGNEKLVFCSNTGVWE